MAGSVGKDQAFLRLMPGTGLSFALLVKESVLYFMVPLSMPIKTSGSLHLAILPAFEQPSAPSPFEHGALPDFLNHSPVSVHRNIQPSVHDRKPAECRMISSLSDLSNRTSLLEILELVSAP